MAYEEYYQQRLYPLQDKVLAIVGQRSSGFYLTGGTALSRFYLQHRYSDDLDFFTNRNENFVAETEEILKEIKQSVGNVHVSLAGTDFLRAFVEQDEIKLKLEFINDVNYHYLNPIEKGDWQLDNWQNILTNKISAISRNMAKDYADILFLSLRFPFNWIDIFEAAKKKDTWVNEIIIAEEIDAFVVNRLKDITWIEKDKEIEKYQLHFKTIAKDILKAEKNSLFKK